jgi:ELWxxDGT repeat protein
MHAWRGVVWLCAVAVGCGGPLLDESLPVDEVPSEQAALLEEPDEQLQAQSPAALEEEEAAGRRGRLEPGQARLVEDIFPPTPGYPPWFGPEPESLVAFRGLLFFAVNTDEGRRELWRSDGTEAGTFAVEEFPPGGPPQPVNNVRELTVVGPQLFFVVGDEAGGDALWVSDGTSAGTRPVEGLAPVPAGSSLSTLNAVGGRLIFFRYIPQSPASPEHYELWRSDGTEAGTVRVRDLGPWSSLSNVHAVLRDTLLFALAEPEHGTELWRTDGTEEGTFLVRDIFPGTESSYPFDLRVVGRNAFFAATDPVHGRGFWITNGTPAGTHFIVGAPEAFNPRLLEVLGEYLYFTVVDPSRQRLRLYKMKVLGSDKGRVRHVATLPNPFADLPDAFPYITTFAVAGGKLFFGMAISSEGPAPRDVQLWVTDGTRSGTRLLHRPLSLGDEFTSLLYAVDDFVLFAGYQPGVTGLELWVSDGTVRGTRLLQDIAPGFASSFPRSFTRVGRQVFFVAHEETHGSELWVLPLRYAHGSCAEE